MNDWSGSQCGEICASGCVVSRCGLKPRHWGGHAHVYRLENGRTIERPAGPLSEFQKESRAALLQHMKEGKRA